MALRIDVRDEVQILAYASLVRSGTLLVSRDDDIAQPVEDGVLGGSEDWGMRRGLGGRCMDVLLSARGDSDRGGCDDFE